MSRTATAARSLVGGLGVWFARYLAWLVATVVLTVGGATVLMLVEDWTSKSLFTAMTAWSMLALGGLLAIPVALVPVGRLFLYTAAGWALVHNLFLLLS